MGCEVYANGDEIACKAGAGKVIAAFPDVCLSPPSPPAGPIPVPYPDTSFSKDMQSGSKTVMIKDQEVMLKDSSFYQTSPLGDEAATNGLGAGVMTHVITGKTYFVAWSMDVQFEGQNVDRHTDLTTSNHASPMANTGPMANVAVMAPSGPPKEGKCECCGKRHEGQQGGVAVSEDKWYGLDEGPEIERQFRYYQNFPPNPRVTPDVEQRRKDLAELAERDRKFQQRKEAVRRARECGLTPEPPCNVYRVFPQKEGDTNPPPPPRGADPRRVKPQKPRRTRARKTAEIDDEWSAKSAKYRQRRGIPAGEKVNHRCPKAAGGCPTGPKNLVPDSRLSEECQEVDKMLTDAQSDAAERWDQVMSPGIA
jgi:hypothetical protein